MDTEKGTNYEINFDIFMVMVEERFTETINVNDVFCVVNRSYGIKKNEKINIGEYVNELAKQSLKFKNEKNILYTFFDITLGLISKHSNKLDERGNLLMNEMIHDRMKELTGYKKMCFEHENEN